MAYFKQLKSKSWQVQIRRYGKEDIYPATFDVSSTIGSLGLSYKF